MSAKEQKPGTECTEAESKEYIYYPSCSTVPDLGTSCFLFGAIMGARAREESGASVTTTN